MICPKCGLANLDHVTRCVRCDAPLVRITQIAEELTPPRARRTKRWHMLIYRWRRWRGFTLHDGEVVGLKVKVRIPNPFSDLWDYIPPKNPLLILPELLIPSLYQFRMRRKITAWIFAILFFGGIAGFFVLAGTLYWLWMAALIATMQVCSLSNLFPMSNLPQPIRSFVMALFSLFLFFLLYQSYQRATYHFLEQHNIEIVQRNGFEEFGIFPGNWIEIRKQKEYKRGDIVLFHPNVTGIQRRQGLEVTWLVSRHDPFRWRIETFERILAVPGDKVKIRRQEIYLNGSETPSKTVPLGGTEGLPDIEFTLGTGEYFLWSRINTQRWRIEFSRVPERMIVGRVVRVILPIWRRQVLQSE